MTDSMPDPDSAEHCRERQALDYDPEVLAEPAGGDVPEYQPVSD